MADVVTGGNGTDGKVSVLRKDGKPVLELLVTENFPAGRVSVYNRNSVETARMVEGGLRLGGGPENGSTGQLIVRSSANEDCAILGVTNEARLVLGGRDRPGRLIMHSGTIPSPNSVDINAVDGTFRLGGGLTSGTLSVLRKDGEEAVRIDGASGDVVLANADCAEEFDLAGPGVHPGTVMVLTDEGSLAPCTKPYDTRVAGVVSGAGTFRPGLLLDRRDTGAERAPIALVGKAYCQVDATDAPVQVGSLLTTAERPGHAMRIGDRARAFGAVLGKALAPLASGCDLIPVLVTLQ